MKPEVAWAMRPTGPLSSLYLTDEQMKAVYAWLDMLAGYTLDAAREAVAALKYADPYPALVVIDDLLRARQVARELTQLGQDLAVSQESAYQSEVEQ